MRPLAREEIVPLPAYARVRDDYRPVVIAHKAARRVSVGPSVTLLFEDRETLRFQVQEMLWVERIERPDAVQQEIDVYNELMPGESELSATLFVEITDAESIRAELDRLIGIDEHVVLVIGEGDAERTIAARFDAKQFEEERISAVQYIRFALDDEARAAFLDEATPAALRITHPAYRHEVLLRPDLRESLAAGIAREPASLMPAIPETPVATATTLFESDAVRVLRPASDGPAPLVVEARAPLPHDAEPDPVVWAEVLETVRRAVSDTTAQHGACRVVANLVPGECPSWQVLPLPR